VVDAAVLSAVSPVSPAAARGAGAVTPDGCSVELYALLPAAGEAGLVHRSIPAGASVLDLGCGTGRIAAPLAALGHEVVAVDESAEMLALVHDARPVRAHIQDLRLPTTFDAVLLASHLLNSPGADDRQALLATCRAHVSAGGQVLIQWHPAQRFDALRAGTTHEGELGPVRARLAVHAIDAGLLDAEVSYRAGDQQWVQPFFARRLDEQQLGEELAAAGLRFGSWLDTGHGWFSATPV